MIKPKGLILALDINEKTRLLEVAQATASFVAAFKVGNLALYQHGWSLISELKQRVGIPVIADLKLMEVPFMAENIARSAHAAEADGIMICGASGLDTLGFCRAAFPGLLFIGKRSINPI